MWNVISFLLGYALCYAVGSVIGLGSVLRWQQQAESTIAHLLAYMLEAAAFSREMKMKALYESKAPKSVFTITKNDDDFMFDKFKQETLSVINTAYESNFITIRFHDWKNLLNYYEERWKNEHRRNR